MCPLIVVWTVLRYVACCACCAEAPQRSAQRALDKGFDVERPDHRRRSRSPKLVVFIDDLDRIPPLKVAEIIAAINLVLAARRAPPGLPSPCCRVPASMGCARDADIVTFPPTRTRPVL
jgi:hypothetical protein